MFLPFEAFPDANLVFVEYLEQHPEMWHLFIEHGHSFPCPVCDKSGRVNGHPCLYCRGTGELQTTPDAGIPLTADFWDCECETGFVHHRTEARCPRCGASREEQPNSRAWEVFAALSDFIAVVNA